MMRVHTVASLALVGMGLASFGAWQLAPAESSALAITADRPPVKDEPAGVDRSHFTTGARVMLDGRLGHARIPQNRDQSTFLLATVTGEAGANSAAAPLDLSIVIDTSGSMRGDKLTNAIEAARGMVRRMRDQDRVTVITYSSQANLLVPPTTIDGFSRERVVASLASIVPQGETCISCGLEMAMRASIPQPDRVSRILLLSDGEATAGVRDDMGFQAIAERCRAMGTTVSTIGVDVEYNERVMGSLARFSNGRHYFVENPMGLPPVFEQEFQSLARTVANGVELDVAIADGVIVEQVFDRQVRREANHVIVPMGTIAPGEEKTILLALRVPAGTSNERPIADMRLRYTDLTTRIPGECSGTLAARATDDPQRVSDLDPFVAARLSRAQTATALLEANELSRRGEFDRARERLQRARRGVSATSTTASRGAPAAAQPALGADFQRQARALEEAEQGFGDEGLAAPAASEAGRRARHRAAAQQRVNADSLDPLSL